jgi:hypothetical protein
MLYYQITCTPSKTEMALSAPPGSNPYGSLVIEPVDEAANDPLQLWELAGFAQATSDPKTSVWDAFLLVNKQTSYAAQAPDDGSGNVKPNTQGVTQADISQSVSTASPLRLWTIDYYGGDFALRPRGNLKQNLNAWKGSDTAGTQLGIYEWQGSANERWTFTPFWR